MGKRGYRPIGIAAANFCFGGKEGRKVLRRLRGVVVISEQPHAIPRRSPGASLFHRGPHFFGLIGAYVVDADAVAVVAGVERINRCRPLPAHPCSHSDPGPIAGEHRQQAAWPGRGR